MSRKRELYIYIYISFYNPLAISNTHPANCSLYILLKGSALTGSSEIEHFHIS